MSGSILQKNFYSFEMTVFLCTKVCRPIKRCIWGVVRNYVTGLYRVLTLTPSNTI